MMPTRRAGSNSATRTLVVSAVGTVPDFGVLMKLGVDAVLAKPLTMLQLQRAVERVLGLDGQQASVRAVVAR